ncbi:MAG: Unknown protein [uncultured Aureispira sp.]|uniref:DUF6265 domain-containing protein n=1 Tax=uncultured Aureispira sp. TaxID=1331704 RepID=A0A6S6U733_9BACT|nr:MAG: Unknown protein [uncultured Aureispira sp.]
MSRDDYISKLFIKNQDKLEQAPSNDLWSKMELQLDQDLPVTQSSTAGSATKVIGLSKYLAAASVLVLLAGATYMFRSMETSTMDQNVFSEPLAIYSDASDTEEEAYDSYKGLPANLEEEKAAEEIQQAAKIVEAVNEKVSQENIVFPNVKTNSTTKQIELESIQIIDEKEADDIILIEPELPQETNTARTTASSSTTTRADLYKNDAIVEQKGLNYNRNYVPQVANTVDNNSAVEEVLNQSKGKGVAGNAPKFKSNARKRSAGRGKIVGKEKKAVKKIKSPMAAAHPRLYPFGFLLGKWEDDNEMEGKSYEVWSLKSSNVLVGKGYKLSNDAERIFEEVMRIEFRDNQIFLVISLDENKKTVDYMLTTFDNERFTFEQKASKNYPDKVIIQQSGLDGYSVIIANNYNFLTTDQQRYLENRNRVSNVQSMRTMQYKD